MLGTILLGPKLSLGTTSEVTSPIFLGHALCSELQMRTILTSFKTGGWL